MSNDVVILQLLQEIRDLLVPIAACFEDQYKEILQQRLGQVHTQFESIMTSQRRRIFPLLFDGRRLTQSEIAEMAGTTQPTVSRFVNLLLEEGFIEESKDENGKTVYRDRYGLSQLV